MKKQDLCPHVTAEMIGMGGYNLYMCVTFVCEPNS